MKEKKHSKRFTSLILMLLITSFFINQTALMAKNNQDFGMANRKVGLNPSKFKSEVSPLTKTSSQSQEQIFTSYAPHWSTKSSFETTIYIRNVQVNNPASFRLSLVLKHRTVQLAEQIVPPAQTVSINVEQELLANGEQAEEEGGATIDFRANSAGGFDAWLQQINETKSLSLSFPFLRKKTSQGKNLDAVVLYYNRNTDAYISLQNTINSFVTVTPLVFINGQVRQIGTKRLKPFEVVSIKVPRFNFDTSENFPYSLGVRINYNAADGAIVAQGWTLNDRIGFSAPFGFHLNGSCNCSPGETRHVYGTGIPIGDGGTMAPGAIFEPLLNLRNNSNNLMTITPVIKFPENQTFRKLTLPTFTLTSQQTIVKNLRQYQLDGTIPASVRDVDLDIAYQGSDGSLITELSSVDVNGSFVAGIPLTCSGHSAAHAAFWRTDGDWDSMLTVANISGVENEVEITISYGGGLYKMVKVLAVDETFMFSVKELQENQTPDINGNVIPANATTGGMNVWTPNVNNGVIINGMVFNPITKTCGYCGAYGYIYDSGVHEFPRNCGQTGFDDRDVGDYIPLFIWLSLSTGQCGSDIISEIIILTPLTLQIDPNNEGLNTIGVGSGDFRVKTQGLWADNELDCDLGGGRQLTVDGHVEIAPKITNVTADGATKITQNNVLGNQNLIHFVTPKGATNSQVTLTATISQSSQQILNDISWEGATESASNPLQATVAKDTAAKNVVKIKYKGNAIKELRVWIVWATITSTNIVISPIPNAAVGIPPGTALALQGGYNFIHTIQPATIVTDSNRPNLSGANVNPPPGGNHPIYGTPLSGGANKKWDNSRQIRIKVLNPDNVSDADIAQPVPSDLLNYPSDDVEGNDDRTVGDETNDPYSDNEILNGQDIPRFGLAHRGGINGNTYELRFQFREFTRLEIEGTWYRISDFYLWRFHFKFLKDNGAWVNDSSSKALDNSGF